MQLPKTQRESNNSAIITHACMRRHQAFCFLLSGLLVPPAPVNVGLRRNIDKYCE